MKTPRIINAMGHIDDDLINSTVHTSTAHTKAMKKSSFLKWSSIAACLIVAFMAVLLIAPMIFGGSNPHPPVDNVDPPLVGDNENKKYYDYGINEGIFSSYIGGNVIAEDKIGSKIESVAVTAGWKNEAGEWLSVENLSAEVYAIEGIQSNVAAALKFIDNGEVLTTNRYYVIMHPNAEYNGMIFPDYKTENPVRYLEESDIGKSNGWQDFGINGEIRTIPLSVGSTYIYQMYSYYIRNDLSHIYANEELPDQLEELPEWLSDTITVGRRSFWYSMGGRIPKNVSLESASKITSENGAEGFIKAEYKILIKDGSHEKEENWIIYFMEEDGIYSAYAVISNENFEFVKAYTESIVKSYQTKQ